MRTPNNVARELTCPYVEYFRDMHVHNLVFPRFTFNRGTHLIRGKNGKQVNLHKNIRINVRRTVQCSSCENQNLFP